MSKLETYLALQLQSSGIASKYEVHCQYSPIEDRRYRVDFAIPAKRLLIECNGGQWVNGRHNRASSLDAEYCRHNLLVAHSWKVLYFTMAQIKSGEAITAIEKCLEVA